MKHYLDEMPLYASGQLNPSQAAEVENHLVECPECRAELAFWQSLATEIHVENDAIRPPENLAVQAIEKIHGQQALPTAFDRPLSLVTSFKLALVKVISLLRAQAYLIKQDIWPASAGITALGVIVALISKHTEAISFVAPLVAAASLAMLYGPENDPSYELISSTPTSAWKILLARLSIVSGYNLVLSLLASLAMVLIVPPDLLGVIILGWLAPMALLSALALLLSIWTSTGNAIVISYSLWMLQYVKISGVFSQWKYSPYWDEFTEACHRFWQSPGWMFIFSAVLLMIALISTRLAERRLNQNPV